MPPRLNNSHSLYSTLGPVIPIHSLRGAIIEQKPITGKPKIRSPETCWHHLQVIFLDPYLIYLSVCVCICLNANRFDRLNDWHVCVCVCDFVGIWIGNWGLRLMWDLLRWVVKILGWWGSFGDGSWRGGFIVLLVKFGTSEDLWVDLWMKRKFLVAFEWMWLVWFLKRIGKGFCRYAILGRVILWVVVYDVNCWSRSEGAERCLMDFGLVGEFWEV